MKSNPTKNNAFAGSMRISNALQLRDEIESLELKCLEKEMYIKELVGELKQSVKPAALFKSALPASVSLLQPVFSNKILRTVLGFAGGALVKRFLSKKKAAKDVS